MLYFSIIVQAQHVIYQISLEWLDQSNFIDGYVSLDPYKFNWPVCNFLLKNFMVLLTTPFYCSFLLETFKIVIKQFIHVQFTLMINNLRFKFRRLLDPECLDRWSKNR